MFWAISGAYNMAGYLQWHCGQEFREWFACKKSLVMHWNVLVSTTPKLNIHLICFLFCTKPAEVPHFVLLYCCTVTLEVVKDSKKVQYSNLNTKIFMVELNI